MIRTILGIVVGYIAMSILMFLLFSALYLVLGTSGSFIPDSPYVSTTWLIAGFVMFFAAATVAGLVSSLIGKSASAGLLMGLVILVVGLILAFFQIASMPENIVRDPQEVPLMEAMAIRQQPVWALFVNPIIGLIGAFVGGRRSGPKD